MLNTLIFTGGVIIYQPFPRKSILLLCSSVNYHYEIPHLMITNFNSCSEAGQDRFVFQLLVRPGNRLDGSFLDIGACNPIRKSNTYALERLGWSGWLVERNWPLVELLSKQRTSTVVHADATKVDWSFLPISVDYLSLDVDRDTLAVLRTLPLTRVEFKIITIEHDAYAYRDGNKLRGPEREALTAAGYCLICGNVAVVPGKPFEDWWVHLSLAARAERFKCHGKYWKNIFTA